LSYVSRLTGHTGYMENKLLKFPCREDCLNDSYAEIWLPLEAETAEGYKLVEDEDGIFRTGKWVWVKLGEKSSKGYHTLHTPYGYIIRYLIWQPDGRILVKPSLPGEMPEIYRPDEIEIEGRVVEVLDDPEDAYGERWILTRRKSASESLYLRPFITVKI
jgi:hypothetical protein